MAFGRVLEPVQRESRVRWPSGEASFQVTALESPQMEYYLLAIIGHPSG
jgi:hypothetical protein